MINYYEVFNQDKLNIFTDASIYEIKKPIGKEYVSAPGFVAVVGEEQEFEDTRILRHSTNNQGEIYAIYMAIQYALANRHRVKKINIFSDSQFAVKGLREWIFSWMKNIHKDTLYNSSGKEVSNQEIFMAIIYTILQYNLEINLFHVRGHFTMSKLKEFCKDFRDANNIKDLVDYRIAEKLIYYNGMVDNLTRRLLKDNNVKYYPPLSLPEYAARRDINMKQYKKLLDI